jgi:hypothetical protein
MRLLRHSAIALFIVVLVVVLPAVLLSDVVITPPATYLSHAQLTLLSTYRIPDQPQIWQRRSRFLATVCEFNRSFYEGMIPLMVGTPMHPRFARREVDGLPAKEAPAWTYLGRVGQFPGDDRCRFLREVGFGWPLVCATYLESYDYTINTDDLLYGTRLGHYVFPSHVLWLRLLADYLGVFALITVTAHLFSRVRSRIRHSRHQCAGCGYSLAGNTAPRCPECGSSCRRARPRCWRGPCAFLATARPRLPDAPPNRVH